MLHTLLILFVCLCLLSACQFYLGRVFWVFFTISGTSCRAWLAQMLSEHLPNKCPFCGDEVALRVCVSCSIWENCPLWFSWEKSGALKLFVVFVCHCPLGLVDEYRSSCSILQQGTRGPPVSVLWEDWAPTVVSFVKEDMALWLAFCVRVLQEGTRGLVLSPGYSFCKRP